MIGRQRGRAVIAVLGVFLVAALWVLPASADLELGGGNEAVVAYSNGDGINVRGAPSVDAGVLTTLPETWAVTIVSGPTMVEDGSYWYEISTETEEGAITGWVSADYLTSSASAAGTETNSSTAQAGPAVVSADGEGLNLRSGPSLAAAIIGGIPDGATVDVLEPGIVDEQGILWSQVNYAGTVGYSAAIFLIDVPAATPEIVDAGEAGALSVLSTAVVSGTDGDGAMVRAEPTSSAGAVSAIFEGAVIEIFDGLVTDENGAAWYQTQIEGVTGWVHGAYLSSDVVAGDAGVVEAASITLGDLFVNEALLYLGTPYLWGGSDPAGFDCSGFVYYIVGGVAGVDFPRAIEEQMASGDFVPYDELQPGDLVFFENTYQEGLSHVGIYLGEGQFVSATGTLDAVGIASLNDPYWSARYLTARRLT